MTLKQLLAFYWAGTLGSFSAAAERLHITQSSLSKRIADLEAHLDCVLFDRSGKKSVLTEAGLQLLPSARKMLDLSETMRVDLLRTGERHALNGVCRFGISELSASTWFPRFADRVRTAHPQLVLEPQIRLTRALERQVERGELDFAVVAGTVANPALACQLVSQVPFRLAASPARMRRGTTITPEDFQRHDMLTHPPESGFAVAFNNWLATHNLKARRTIICSSLTIITVLTVAGVGMSLLPMPYIRPLVVQGKLVTLRLKPQLPPLNYHFIWHRDDVRPITRMMREVLLPEIDFSVPNALWT